MYIMSCFLNIKYNWHTHEFTQVKLSWNFNYFLKQNIVISVNPRFLINLLHFLPGLKRQAEIIYVYQPIFVTHEHLRLVDWMIITFCGDHFLINWWSVQCISQSVVQSGHITVYIINIINCRDTNNANTYFTRYCTFLLLCMELRLVAFVCACTKQVAMRQLQPCRSYSIFFSRWPWLSLDWRSTWNFEINFTMKKETHP